MIVRFPAASHGLEPLQEYLNFTFPISPVMTARHVFYEGRVQGVGFRYGVRQIATGFDVTGWVRNLPDGRVEMLAAGEKDEVEAFLQAIHDSQLASFIRAHTPHEIAPPAGLRGFEIVH
jgi:acylphosphatase